MKKEKVKVNQEMKRIKNIIVLLLNILFDMWYLKKCSSN